MYEEDSAGKVECGMWKWNKLEKVRKQSNLISVLTYITLTKWKCNLNDKITYWSPL